MTIDCDNAFRRLKLLEQQLNERRLPGTTLSDDEYEFAPVHMERNLINCRLTFFVRLAHAVQIDHTYPPLSRGGDAAQSEPSAGSSSAFYT